MRYDLSAQYCQTLHNNCGKLCNTLQAVVGSGQGLLMHANAIHWLMTSLSELLGTQDLHQRNPTQQEPNSTGTQFNRNPTQQVPNSTGTQLNRNPTQQGPNSIGTQLNRYPTQQEPNSTRTQFNRNPTQQDHTCYSLPVTQN